MRCCSSRFLYASARVLFPKLPLHPPLCPCVGIPLCHISPDLCGQLRILFLVISSSGRFHKRLFKKHGILPFEDLVKYFILKFMHNFSHGKLPFSYNEMWITNRMRNLNIELRNADNLYIPAHHMATVKRFPLFNFPKIWNDAPDIKNNPTM